MDLQLCTLDIVVLKTSYFMGDGLDNRPLKTPGPGCRHRSRPGPCWTTLFERHAMDELIYTVSILCPARCRCCEVANTNLIHRRVQISGLISTSSYLSPGLQGFTACRSGASCAGHRACDRMHSGADNFSSANTRR